MIFSLLTLLIGAIFNLFKLTKKHTIREKIYISGTEMEQGGIQEGGISAKVIPLRGPALVDMTYHRRIIKFYQ